MKNIEKILAILFLGVITTAVAFTFYNTLINKNIVIIQSEDSI